MLNFEDGRWCLMFQSMKDSSSEISSLLEDTSSSENVFYKFGHVWKSEGVVVGFEYDNDLVDERNKRWQTNMLGHWVVFDGNIVKDKIVKDTREVKLNLHV